MNDSDRQPSGPVNGLDLPESPEQANGPRGESSKGQGASLWSRAARILRPSSTSSLREDIEDALLTEMEDAGFSPEERAMLHNILRFREVRVEDVMIPRANIAAVEQSVSLGELLGIFEESGHSRMPVYADTLDDPRGMVHIRDLLSHITRQARNKRRAGQKVNGDKASRAQAAAGNGTVSEKPARQPKAEIDLMRVDLTQSVADAGIIRKVLFVPPSMLASDLMKKMQANRTQMALVIDEYGGTDGLVSHEDIVEIVIGDIDDEHDDEEALFERLSDDILVADARVELEEIAEEIGPDFDIADRLEDIDTLGGLIFSALGRIPARGEVVQAVPNFEFHILGADPRRVKKVRIVRMRPAARRRLTKAETEAEEKAAEAARLTETAPAASPVNEGDVTP